MIVLVYSQCSWCFLSMSLFENFCWHGLDRPPGRHRLPSRNAPLCTAKWSQVGSLRLRGMHKITQRKQVVFAQLGPRKDWLCEQGRFGLKTPDPKIKAGQMERWRRFRCQVCQVLQREKPRRRKLLYAVWSETIARPTAAASSSTVVAARR